ncbi:MAG: SMI1/KNR4 family protein [Streptococcus sp.]
MLKYNGGDTIDATFKIDKEGSDIHSFYGFSSAKYYSNFKCHLMEKGLLEDFIDNHYLPIAKDSFGNSILIGIDAKNYNKIAFYDHEKQKYFSFNIDFIEFLKRIKSPVVYIPSIG